MTAPALRADDDSMLAEALGLAPWSDLTTWDGIVARLEWETTHTPCPMTSGRLTVLLMAAWRLQERQEVNTKLGTEPDPKVLPFRRRTLVGGLDRLR